MLALFALFALLGCDPVDPLFDTDGDGVRDAFDCAPEDAAVFQTNTDPIDEDGLDTNCDGVDGVDSDGDGHASLASGGHDCNDQDPDVHPDAPEVPDDGQDNDCDGGDGLCDADGDGADSALCDGPDCDDTSSLVAPGAEELCDGLDTDCDGDLSPSEQDADSDGVRGCAGDCDDTLASVAPGLEEVCDRLDNDCDGELPADEEDADGDDWPACQGDCDDDDPSRHPGAVAVCDGLDTDCDGALEAGDEDEDGDGDPVCNDCDDDNGVLHELDLDGDGETSCEGDCNDLVPTILTGGVDDWGDGADGDCDGADGIDADGDGWASNGVPSDCLDDPADPTATSTWPGAPDAADDGIDQSCDGLDGVDADGDGVASEASGGEDCNDDPTDPLADTSFPGAEDLVGNGADTDCDGVDGVDADGDGVPSIGSGGDDCNDDPTDPVAASTWPGASDPAGDGVDTGCDGTDGVDADGDGVASEASGGTDCNDDANDPLAALTFPGAEDLVGNFADTDCDGADGVDADGDGVASIASGGDDCDDAPASPHAAATWPGAPDTVGDGVDQDCDAVDGVDADGDGVASEASGGTDCLDDPSEPLSAISWPGAADGWGDGVDTNCDDLDGVDADRDGFAINAVAELQDCDDDDPIIYPGSDELPGWQSPRLGLDGDCDGFAHESLADADVHLLGASGDDRAGGWVASAADIDGDGLDDVLVGAHRSSTAHSDAGSVYLILGASMVAGGSIQLDDAHAELVGEAWNDQLGTQVVGVGDADGAGVPDVLVGAPFNDEASDSAGQAYLFRGEDLLAGGVFDASIAWASFPGQGLWNQAGVSVGAAGDVDGDGLADLLIGANLNSGGGTRSGKAYLVLGSQVSSGGNFNLGGAHASFVGENPYDFAGGNVTGVGDVDGDGLDDVLIAATGNDQGGDDAGKAYLFFGDSLLGGGTFDLSQADLQLVGEAEDDHAGFRIGAAGDVDGDGLADLIVGANGNDETINSAGQSYVVFGATAMLGGSLSLGAADVRLLGEGPSDYAATVAGAGDVDGDGLDDVLVGAHGHSADAGMTYLVLGSTIAGGGDFALADADAAFLGEASADFSGSAVGPAGDVDGDGRADFLVGAYGNDETLSGAGKAYVLISPW